LKLSKYTQEAIKKELENDERDTTIKAWEKLMGSGQYQKIKQLEKEVEKLKQDHVTAKEIELLGMRIDKFGLDGERHYRELLNESKSRIKVYREAVEILKKNKKR